MTQPYVILVILNTNRRADTLACLASLAETRYPNYHIIVLDNASTDGSVDAIRANFPAVQIIELTENLGYAGNNNVGIQAALAQGADWVWLLNEDTLIDPACLATLVQEGNRDPRIGILGPMVYHHDEPTFIQSGGGKLDRFWQGWHVAQNQRDQGQLTAPHQVDWIAGCAILVRRSVIEAVGMLDARFFYYWEETEWCVRAHKAGWSILHVPAAKIWHKGVTLRHRLKPSAQYYDTRNHLLTLAKHGAPLSAWIVNWWQLGRTVASWTLKPKWRDQRENRDAILRGARDFLQQRWGQM